jgi:hypothetical protein
MARRTDRSSGRGRSGARGGVPGEERGAARVVVRPAEESIGLDRVGGTVGEDVDRQLGADLLPQLVEEGPERMGVVPHRARRVEGARGERADGDRVDTVHVEDGEGSAGEGLDGLRALRAEGGHETAFGLLAGGGSGAMGMLAADRTEGRVRVRDRAGILPLQWCIRVRLPARCTARSSIPPCRGGSDGRRSGVQHERRPAAVGDVHGRRPDARRRVVVDRCTIGPSE